MQKKMSALMMALVLSLSLIGCGGSSQPVNGEAVDNTESTESNTETVESNKETTTETEITDGKVAEADKPAESTTRPTAEPSPTEKPVEPTASPEPTPTVNPEQTATPEPTPTPHVHEYAETVTKQPSCAEDGVKTLTCNCGDSKTEAIPATGNHNWVEEMETVVIPSTGHVVTTEVQVQVGVGETRHEYECVYCGHREDSADAIEEHYRSTIPEGNIDHSFSRTLVWDYPGEPIYETQTVSEWIVDTPEQTTVVGTGRFTCSVCGATK